MQLRSPDFDDMGRIPEACALCRQDPQSHVVLSDNRNPALRWEGVPTDTRSFVLICHDPDVPADGRDVNTEGRRIAASVSRRDFIHWVLVDLPGHTLAIEHGQFSSCVTPRGKPGPQGPLGTRQGVNDYTGWFADDANMSGDYFGYDGPCPPWNDERVHHYLFTLYALDVAHAPVHGRFTAQDVRAAIRPHIRATATLAGRYTLNPTVALT